MVRLTEYRWHLRVAVMCLILLAAYSMAQGQSSPNYQVELDVISGGGGEAGSTNYLLHHSAVQSSVIGTSSSANYINNAGFWSAASILRGFQDIFPINWAYGYIMAVYNAGITTGYGDGRYGPEDLVTREQMAAFIVRAVEGELPLNYCDSGISFPDVTPDMWSCKYIKRLKELGITTGYGDGRYGPYDLVPREQMAAFIVRAVQGEPPMNYCASGVPFPDVTPTMWSCDYIKRLKELGITTGYGDGTYGPYDPVTRAQMAAFLSRAFLGMP